MYWSPQLLGRSFQKARNFTASSHQNAGFSIWVIRHFPGPSQREGGPPPAPNTQRPGVGTQILVPLNFSAVVVPLSLFVVTPVCSEVTPDSWIGYSNTHAFGGVANSASDVSSCQSSCIADRSCTRVDWSPLAPAGQRCWLHNLWNSWQPRRSITGVTHYELRRSSVGYWVKYPNTRVNGGIATAADGLASCKELCAANQSCIWIDWSPEGRRCLVHEFSNVFETRISAPGVSHYRLYRGIDGYCGKERVACIAFY